MLAKQKQHKKKEGRLRRESLGVLEVLRSADSGLILSALALKTGREMGNLFRTVRLLEEKGLVSRSDVHGLNVISLTKAGDEVLRFSGSVK